jgi:hypothetical protein
LSVAFDSALDLDIACDLALVKDSAKQLAEEFRKACTAVEERRFQRRVKVNTIRPGFSPSSLSPDAANVARSTPTREGHDVQLYRLARHI